MPAAATRKKPSAFKPSDDDCPQVRARPASAQPSTRAPITPTINVVGGASPRREYWPRHLPPPWDDNNISGDCSSRSGSGVGGDDGADGYYRGCGLRRASSGRRARVPAAAAAAAAASLELRAKKGGQRTTWDGCCAAGKDVAARRALVARAAAAAVEAGEAAGMKRKTSTEKALLPGGAGRPYMSRADRAAEEAKEVAYLRSEAEFWRGEAGAARQEAVETCKRLETQEQHIAAVLRKTTEVLPGYRYGLNFGGCSGPEMLADEPQLSVLEHRRELEKVLVIRRLKGQVSRLSERLAAAEAELIRVKRSCQFTALTEMRSTGEEYVYEVERLRAILKKRGEPTDLLSKEHRGPRVVDIPSAVTRPLPNGKPPNIGETASNIDVASSALESADHPDHPLSSDGSRSGSSSPAPGSKVSRQKRFQRSSGFQPDQQHLRYPQSQGRRRSHHRRVYSSSQNNGLLSKDAQHLLDREPHAYCGEDDINEVQQRTLPPRWKHFYPSHQQRSLAAAPSVAPRQVSRTRGDSPNRSKGRRERGRRGKGVVRSRARAGLLGVPAPVGSQGYITIDAPMRGGATAPRGDPGVTDDPRHDGDGRGVDRRGTVARGGRVPMTTEMEMDVMKGLVLAQHQRIERQRGRMKELERDLRDYRRATVGGGEWPQASRTFSTSVRPASPSSRGGLTPSRSAPVGLHGSAGERVSVPATTTTAVPRTHTVRAHSGGSRAPTAAQRRAEASKLEETAWLKLNEVSRIGGRSVEGGTAPFDVSLAMNKPRTAAATAAAAVGSALTEVWCGRDLGGGLEGKHRPKSAASRFSNSPGRRRARRTGEAGNKKGGGGGGGDNGVACEEVDSLPDGWAEAVDRDTGHTYYFSEKRSTWVKPTGPASPRNPVSANRGAVANADEVTDVAVGLVAAATGLACSRLAASTNKEMGAEQTEAREGEEKEDVKGRGGEKEERFVAQTTIPTPLTVANEVTTKKSPYSPASIGRRGGNERGGSRGEARHIERQGRSEPLCKSGGLGEGEAGSGESQRYADGRLEPHVERHLSNEEPSGREASGAGGGTPDIETLDRDDGEPPGKGTRIEQSSNPAEAGSEGLPMRVDDSDTPGQHRQSSLARNEPHLRRENMFLSCTSTGAASVLRQENEDSPGLAHTVTTHAKERALSNPPDLEPSNNKRSTASPNEGVGRSAGSVRGRPKERRRGRRHRDGEANEDEGEQHNNLSFDSEYAPPRPPESGALPEAPALTTAPIYATRHADAACRELVDGQVGHSNGIALDGGEHPLSLEETENAMAALIATLRPKPNAPSFGEQSSPSLAVAPLDRDPLDTSSQIPPRWSSSSFPLTPDEADADVDPLSPQVYTTRRQLQRQEESAEALLATPSHPIDDRHDVHRRIKGTHNASAVDDEKHHQLLPDTGKTADESVVYGHRVSWDGLDAPASSGIHGGNAGGGESGEGDPSEAATGVYEDDFDDD